MMSISQIILAIVGFVVCLILVLFVKNTVLVEKVVASDYERILFVPGIKTPPWATAGWKAYLQSKTSGADIVVIKDRYHYNNTDDLDRLMRKVRDILQDGVRTRVVTHSYGGVLAVAALQNDQLSEYNVERVIALAPPYNPAFRGLYASWDHIGFSVQEIDVPVTTLCGWFDTTVPCSSTVFPEGVSGGRIFSEHSLMLFPHVFGGGVVMKNF